MKGGCGRRFAGVIEEKSLHLRGHAEPWDSKQRVGTIHNVPTEPSTLHANYGRDLE